MSFNGLWKSLFQTVVPCHLPACGGDEMAVFSAEVEFILCGIGPALLCFQTGTSPGFFLCNIETSFKWGLVVLCEFIQGFRKRVRIRIRMALSLTLEYITISSTDLLPFQTETWLDWGVGSNATEESFYCTNKAVKDMIIPCITIIGENFPHLPNFRSQHNCCSAPPNWKPGLRLNVVQGLRVLHPVQYWSCDQDNCPCPARRTMNKTGEEAV